MADENDKAPKKQEQLLQILQQLIFQNYLMVFNLTGVKNAIKKGNDSYFFTHDHATNQQVDKQLAQMATQMNVLLLNGIKREWKRGEDNFWYNLKLSLSKTARQQKLNDHIREQATQSARDKTAEAFYNEKRNGFTLSERVWNLSRNAKKEIEIILQNGIKEGKSASEISKSLKGYLNEPERLFRRVRNKETGELELSKAAQKYRPGQGVYRSAYKNAMRLARTEIKAAYHEAQWNAAQNNPLIVGWKIVLSNNHTTLINGKPVPFKDICDELVGEYPKSFKFRGWHPQCRCQCLPILAGQEEQKDLYRKIFEGKRDDWQPSGIKRVPKAFDDWVQSNQERAKGWANMPHFIRDNRKFVQTKFEVDIYTDEEKKFTHARKTKKAMERVLSELSALYPDVPNTELAAIHHYTRNGGNYRQLNKQMEKGTLTDFNSAAQTLITQGLEKLPTYQGSVYRGMIIKRKEFERVFGGGKGDVIQQNRFISSSRDVDVALVFATKKQSTMKKNEIQVVFEIKSQNGRDIERISEYNGNFVSENQKEVLFLNNTSFEIEDTKQVGNVVWVKLMEI